MDFFIEKCYKQSQSNQSHRYTFKELLDCSLEYNEFDKIDELFNRLIDVAYQEKKYTYSQIITEQKEKWNQYMLTNNYSVIHAIFKDYVHKIDKIVLFVIPPMVDYTLEVMNIRKPLSEWKILLPPIVDVHHRNVECSLYSYILPLHYHLTSYIKDVPYKNIHVDDQIYKKKYNDFLFYLSNTFIPKQNEWMKALQNIGREIGHEIDLPRFNELLNMDNSFNIPSFDMVLRLNHGIPPLDKTISWIVEMKNHVKRMYALRMKEIDMKYDIANRLKNNSNEHSNELNVPLELIINEEMLKYKHPSFEDCETLDDYRKVIRESVATYTTQNMYDLLQDDSVVQEVIGTLTNNPDLETLDKVKDYIRLVDFRLQILKTLSEKKIDDFMVREIRTHRLQKDSMKKKYDMIANRIIDVERSHADFLIIHKSLHDQMNLIIREYKTYHESLQKRNREYAEYDRQSKKDDQQMQYMLCDFEKQLVNYFMHKRRLTSSIYRRSPVVDQQPPKRVKVHHIPQESIPIVVEKVRSITPPMIQDDDEKLFLDKNGDVYQSKDVMSSEWTLAFERNNDEDYYTMMDYAHEYLLKLKTKRERQELYYMNDVPNRVRRYLDKFFHDVNKEARYFVVYENGDYFIIKKKDYDEKKGMIIFTNDSKKICQQVVDECIKYNDPKKAMIAVNATKR